MLRNQMLKHVIRIDEENIKHNNDDIYHIMFIKVRSTY